jgi:hypothetical protein
VVQAREKTKKIFSGFSERPNDSPQANVVQAREKLKTTDNE